MYRENALLATFGICACLIAGGCNTVSDLISDAFAPREPIDVSAVYWDGPRIRPGIALDIQVGTATSAPQGMHVLVDQNGEITLQYLLEHPVQCDGLTLEALKQKLLKEYQAFIKQPQITVTFGSYDSGGVSPWGTVTVLGEIGRPGPVNMPSTMDLTVTKVLQVAGGLRPYADKTRIRVMRCDKEGRQTKTIVNLNEIGEHGRIDKDMVLRAGDVVWVPQTWY